MAEIATRGLTFSLLGHSFQSFQGMSIFVCNIMSYYFFFTFYETLETFLYFDL